MNRTILLLIAAFGSVSPLNSQTLFDNSLVHTVKITSLYDGLQDTLTSDYLLSFNILQIQIRDIPYTVCKIELDGHALDTIGIRYKGFNSWWASPKKPLKLDFNRIRKGQNYQGFKKLNLHNRAADPTALRENLCYELLRHLGLPAPRTAFARVYFDGSYAGLYRLVEELDNVFLDDRFGDHEGNLYKQNAAGSGGYALNWLGGKQDAYYPHLKLENHTTENDWSALVHFLGVLNNAPDAVFADSIAAVFDVNGFLSVLALDLAVNNLDFYLNSARNYYLYHDKGGDGKFHWLPWDYNLTWRSDPLPLEPAVTPDVPVLVRRLLRVPAFRQAFLERYCLLREHFDAAVLLPRIAADSALIRPWLAVDASGDFALEDFEQNFSAPWQQLPGLKPFLSQRSAAIDAFLQSEGVDCATVVAAPEKPGPAGGLHIFPNPARQYIQVEWSSDRPGNLLLFDAAGRLLRTETVPATPSATIALDALPPGIYFLRAETEAGSAAGWFLKL